MATISHQAQTQTQIHFALELGLELELEREPEPERQGHSAYVRTAELGRARARAILPPAGNLDYTADQDQNQDQNQDQGAMEPVSAHSSSGSVVRASTLAYGQAASRGRANGPPSTASSPASAPTKKRVSSNPFEAGPPDANGSPGLQRAGTASPASAAPPIAVESAVSRKITTASPAPRAMASIPPQPRGVLPSIRTDLASPPPFVPVSSKSTGNPRSPAPASAPSTVEAADISGLGHSYDRVEVPGTAEPAVSRRGSTRNGGPKLGSPVPAVSASTPATPAGTRKVQKRTSIGPWDFVKSIGAGSMGQVKLAINRYTRQPAAVKIVAKASLQSSSSGTESNEAKDARVIREAAVGKLVNHPNISQLYEIYSMTSHYYLVFEYIAGGQLLDYIITHGSVKEVQARRIAREITSALDYCHRHSIVHRDLKIENILITEKGGVKIIDFGLANLFRRDSLLKTYCGSLYFAAPELLNAMPYVGPEIDIWSFGVVLYVLVCGKVPFEDKSMSALHAKIKRGIVEYPTWLSPLCTDLLSRMLVVAPSERATMREVLHHPWINKGYDDLPNPHIPSRRPLELPLEPLVIQELAGMQFGTPEALVSELESVLSSHPYREALAKWYEAHATGSSLSLNPKAREVPFRNADPLNSFHPLISMYILAEERLQRLGSLRIAPATPHERLDVRKIGGSGATSATGSATSGMVPVDLYHESGSGSRTPSRTPSRLSANTPSRTSSARSAHSNLVESGPAPVPEGRRVVTMPSSIVSPPTSLAEPVSSDATVHTTADKDDSQPLVFSPVMETPTAPPARATRSRAKTYGNLDTHMRPRLDFGRNGEPGGFSANEYAQDYSTPPNSASLERQKGNLGSLLRRLSLRKQKTRSESQQSQDFTSQRSPLQLDRDTSEELLQQSEFTSPQQTHGAGGRAVRRHASARQGPTLVNSSISSTKGDILTMEGDLAMAPPSQYQAQDASQPHPAPSHSHSRAKSQGYAYAFSGQNNTGAGAGAGAVVKGEMPSIEAPKQVFFKGFFSVQSTSTRPLIEIRHEIIRTLRDLAIEYVEIKGGFRCIHGASPHSTRPASSAVNSPVSTPTRHRRNMSSLGNSPTKDHSDAFSSSESVELGGADMLGHDPSRVPTPVRFEISIVRVPLLSLHGVQFKKISGNVWEYKTLAQDILEHLHL